MEKELDATKATNRLMQRAGFHFALGVTQFVGVLVIAGYVLGLLRPVDDCDVSRFSRCGMEVATDAKTGKQYLITSGGGIIERVKP